MTDHSQCRLLLGHRGAAFPWDWQPCSHPGPSPPHRTLPHQAPAAELLALPHPREQAQSLCPPPHHTCPLPTRLTPHLAAARPAAHLP